MPATIAAEQFVHHVAPVVNGNGQLVQGAPVRRSYGLRQVTEPKPSLASDLLTGFEEIAAYCGQPVRRVRHLYYAHGLPAFPRGRVVHARKSQIDLYFTGDDQQPTER
jgi:hypothetical protein